MGNPLTAFKFKISFSIPVSIRLAYVYKRVNAVWQKHTFRQCGVDFPLFAFFLACIHQNVAQCSAENCSPYSLCQIHISDVCRIICFNILINTCMFYAMLCRHGGTKTDIW